MEHQTLGRRFICPIGPATEREFILDWRIFDCGGHGLWIQEGMMTECVLGVLSQYPNLADTRCRFAPKKIWFSLCLHRALRVPAGRNFMFWIWLVQYCNCPSVLKIFLPSHNFLLSFKLETDVLKTKIWWFINYESICCIIFASVTVYYHVLTTF